MVERELVTVLLKNNYVILLYVSLQRDVISPK